MDPERFRLKIPKWLKTNVHQRRRTHPHPPFFNWIVDKGLIKKSFQGTRLGTPGSGDAGFPRLPPGTNWSTTNRMAFPQTPAASASRERPISMADLQQFFTGKLYVLVQQLKLPAEELLWSALPCARRSRPASDLHHPLPPLLSVTCAACSCVEVQAMTPAASCNKNPNVGASEAPLLSFSLTAVVQCCDSLR